MYLFFETSLLTTGGKSQKGAVFSEEESGWNVPVRREVPKAYYTPRAGSGTNFISKSGWEDHLQCPLPIIGQGKARS